ncbi:hypothetical protein JAB4_059430 (plasmid) [Janthinobacterium sp. HH102]|nr:hypothetical protein JAB4_059430 [Janthinobacterium sp. HH102]
MGAGEFLGRWPLRALDLVDRSARGLQARARRCAAGRRCRPVLPVEFSRPPWTGAAAADRAASDVRQVGAAGPPAGQPAARRCQPGRARLDAVRTVAGEFLGRWPLRALDLVDRSARGLQARALAVHQLARAGALCSSLAHAVVLLAVDASPLYLWIFLGRCEPVPLQLIAQPATCARPASLAHQLASLQHAAAGGAAPASMPSGLARANFSAAGRCSPWIWQTAPREACRPAPWPCTSWRARERSAAR